MGSIRNSETDVSITKYAGLYVTCLIGGGLSVLNAFLHPNSVAVILACSAAAVMAVVGIVYCTRKLGKTLNA